MERNIFETLHDEVEEVEEAYGNKTWFFYPHQIINIPLIKRLVMMILASLATLTYLLMLLVLLKSIVLMLIVMMVTTLINLPMSGGHFFV